MSINDSAVLAERRRVQAQIRSLGLRQDAKIEFDLAHGRAGVNEPARTELIDAISPVEIRNVLVPLRDVEFRDASGTGDGSFTLTGYAAVYDQETVLYDSSWWRLREVIAPSAFDNVLSTNPDVHLNTFLHDFSRPVARTGIDGIGALELKSDKTGLAVFARLNPQDPDVQALAQKMPFGIVDQMSFMFTIAAAKYTSEIDEDDFEDELRTISEIGELYDVLVCAQGAYPQTSAELAMRSLTGALGRAGVDLAGLLDRRGAEPGDEAPAPAPAADDTPPAPENDVPAEDERAKDAAAAERARTATAMRMRIATDN